MSPKHKFALTMTVAAFSAAAVAQAAPIALEAESAPEPIRSHLVERKVVTAGAIQMDARNVERRAAERRAAAEERRDEAAYTAQGGAIDGVSLATLNAIAACESGGDPTAVNAAGYYGKYQFSPPTWAAVGGSGNPAEASEAEQDYRAALLYNQSGPGQWPVCGV